MSSESKFGGRLQAVAVIEVIRRRVDDAGRRMKFHLGWWCCCRCCRRWSQRCARFEAVLVDASGFDAICRLAQTECTVVVVVAAVVKEKTKSDHRRRGDANESATVAAIRTTSALAARQPAVVVAGS